MLCMRRLELMLSDEVASAAVLDHVAKSVACIGIGVMAGHPKGVLGQFLRSRSVYIRGAGHYVMHFHGVKTRMGRAF